MNEIKKIINDKDTITFILITDGDTDYWWWEVPRYDWEHYKHLNPNATTHDFVNDEEYASDCGFSCGGFDTVEDAIADYKQA